MRLLAYSVLLLILIKSLSRADEQWPPDSLAGAWIVTEATSDGEHVEEAKGNLLVFHVNRMIYAVDRNYRPPNPEVCAIGYKFYAIKTSASQSLGLVRVQRGKLKFMLKHEEKNSNEFISITIEDYSENRVREVVRFNAERADTTQASNRIAELLESPKLKVGNTGTGFVDTLTDWLKSVKDGEPRRSSPAQSGHTRNTDFYIP